MGRPPKSVDFFRVWSPEMAYVLGYWWADGCMRIKRVTGAHEVSIASNDLEHLEVMANLIGASYHLRKVSLLSQTYVISFCSKEMYYDLLQHGGTPRKSRIIEFPYIPEELLPHFVRGVVDGDGTLSWNAGKPILQIYSGSEQFLQGITYAVENATGIPSPTPHMTRTTLNIKWSTIRAKCLVAWLYVEHQGLALERKSAIASQFLEWQPKKRPNKETITEAMQLNFPDYLPL